MARKMARTEKGFSLIEVLISVLILSATSVAVFQVYASSLRLAKAVEAGALARIRAEGLLSDVLAGNSVELGARTGAYDDGASWEVTIKPYESDIEDPQARIGAFHVTATVRWRARGSERTYSLSTLRLGPGS